MEQDRAAIDTQIPRQRYLGSIRTRLILSFSLLFAAVMISVEWIDINGIPFTADGGRQGQQAEEAFRSLTLVADLKKERLLRWLGERRADVSVVASNRVTQHHTAWLHTAWHEFAATGDTQDADLWARLQAQDDYRDLLDLIDHQRGVGSTPERKVKLASAGGPRIVGEQAAGRRL